MATVIRWTLVAPEPWIHLDGVRGSGSITVAGRAIPGSDAAALTAELRPGAEIEVPAGAAMEIRFGNGVAWEVAESSRLILPGESDETGARSPAQLLRGELRVLTGPGFEGSTLVVHTPEAQVHVRGSLLSIQCDEAGTCVCVLEGRVEVGVGDDDLVAIPPGQRRVVPREAPPQILPVAPPHQAGAEEFERRARARLEE